jgi:hypothetical protein
MGRQITFHMLQKDKEEFFRFLASRHDVFATAWTSDSSEVTRSKSPAHEKGSLAVWEPRSGALRVRKRIVRDDGSVVYEFDRQISVLEFNPSDLVTHEGVPALLQGRLYSFLNDMEVETVDLFRTASQWIRRSFEPCPYELLGGYIGPAAMRWHRDGGVILPMFNPPATQAWEDFIRSQAGDRGLRDPD